MKFVLNMIFIMSNQMHPKITNHANERWVERFSYLNFDNEYENSKPATKSQRKAIASTSTVSYDHKNNNYQVSPAGVDQSKAVPILLAKIEQLERRLLAAGL